MASVTNTPQSPHGNSFPLFPLLPRELRDQIWEIAVHHAQQAPDGSWPVCIFPPSSAIDGTSSTFDEPLVVHEKPLSLMQVNTESRTVAMKLSQRPYDPCRDILFLANESSGRFYNGLGIVKDDSPSRLLNSVRILAVDASDWHSSLEHMPGILRNLPSLRQLFLVFAVSSGDTDEGEAVSLSKGQLAQPLMRSLKEAELEGIGFTALYSWLPTEWQTSASRHVQEWLGDIELAVIKSSQKGLPSYRNDEGQPIVLETGGSCFVGS